MDYDDFKGSGLCAFLDLGTIAQREELEQAKKAAGNKNDLIFKTF
jgi:hypothetical protein